MKRRMEKSGDLLDRAVSEIRETSVTSGQVEQAVARVLATLNAEHNKVVLHPAVAEANAGDRIRSCSDFQSLIPAYRSSSLTPSRKILFEDHIRECHECRKSLNDSGKAKPAPVTRRHHTGNVVHIGRWAVAAAALMLVVFSQRNAIRDFVFPIDVHATAQAVNGGLFRVSGQDIRSIAAGERIDREQAVRTGTDSGAVLQLADGSRIEMNSRSELSLERARDGVSIKLSRGSVIVTAAKQRTGHLYVATPDCDVSVVGTVFSVSSGTKGSRVSVIEGEVHVQQGASSQAIHPGEQISTSVAMGSTPVQDEIAWSRDRDTHLAMLKEFVTVSRDLGNRLGMQEMRHTSNLLALVPGTTLVFASLPNFSQPVAESYASMKQRISENAALQGWWNSNAGAGQKGMSVDEMVSRLTKVGSYLGSEIIIAVSNETGDTAPVLLSETARPEDLENAVHELAGTDTHLRLVRNAAELAAAATTNDGLILYIDRQIVIASPNARQIQKALTASNAFATTALYTRVAQAYTEGVGWLLAVDLQQVTKAGNVSQLVMEQKTGSAGSSYQAVLAFNQARTGPAAWLGPAGPIGAAEFVSSNAYGAAAIVTKDPALILDDVFELMKGDGNALDEFQKFQQDHHVDVRYDLAAPLGNEFLFAVDGPILPTPSWKLVVEVNDSARLQNSIQWAVSELNVEAGTHQKAPVNASAEVVGGRTYYTLKSSDLPVEFHYTFWAGYMIAGPSRVLLEEAIQHHDSGDNLARSDRFRAQLPADGRSNASGFMYQNLQAVASAIPVAGIQDTVRDALPTLVFLYGEPDRIMVSSKGVLGANIASLAGLTGMIHAIGIK